MIRAVFLLLLLAWPMTASALTTLEPEPECPDYADPEIKVTPLVANPLLNTTRSLAELGLMSGEDQDKYSGTKHEIPVGLTAAAIDMETHYNVKTYKAPHARDVCTQVGSFEITFGFKEMTVYIAKEIEAGTCGFRTVLAHETQHVTTDKKLVEDFSRLLPDLLRKDMAAIGVVRAPTQEEAEEKVRLLVSSYMRELGQSLSTLRNRRQSAIDTEDEYDRLSKSCNGQLGELISVYGPD